MKQVTIYTSVLKSMCDWSGECTHSCEECPAFESYTLMTKEEAIKEFNKHGVVVIEACDKCHNKWSRTK